VVSGERDRAPRGVWAATAALFLLVVLWAVALPAYRVVDEPQNLSTALRVADDLSYPPPGAARLRPEVAASYPYADFPGGDERTFVPPRPVAIPPPRWPTWRELERAPVPAAQVGQVDQMTQHPPLWPLLAAAEVRGLGLEGRPADTALLVLRLLQGWLLLPVPWLVWRTARLLGAADRGAAAAAWLPVGVPQLLHIGASVTNGDLLLLEIAALTPLLVALAAGDRRTRVAVGAGLLVALTLLTKSFGFLLPPCLLLVLGLGWRRGDGPPWRAAGYALGLPLLLAGWWYGLRLASTGSLQPSGYPPRVEALLAQDYRPTEAAQVFAGSLLKTSWLDLGWLETPAPLAVVLPLWLAVAAMVVAGLRRRPWLAAAALAPFVLLLAAVCLRELSTYAALHAVYGAQGRYLFPGLVGVAGVAALALDARGRGWALLRMGIPPLCLLGHIAGLNLAAGWFWAGGLRALLDWSPLPVPLLLAAALGVVAAAAVAAASARGAQPAPRTNASALPLPA